MHWDGDMCVFWYMWQIKAHSKSWLRDKVAHASSRPLWIKKPECTCQLLGSYSATLAATRVTCVEQILTVAHFCSPSPSSLPPLPVSKPFKTCAHAGFQKRTDVTAAGNSESGVGFFLLLLLSLLFYFYISLSPTSWGTCGAITW